jgi:Predicted nucleoside-diphosphate-sugar epimerases
MIVVAGGSGTLGSLLVPLLVGRGEPVRVVTRDPAAAGRKLSGVELVAGDVTRPEDARRAVEGARVVVSAITGFASAAGLQAVDVEGNRILADAAARAGVEQLVLVSIVQASADHPIELFRAKFAAEQAVRASGVGWTIVRPTAYLETWLGLIGGPLVATGKTLVFGRGRNPINFVSALDVARFVDLAIADPSYRGKVVEVPGPENLTVNQLVAIIETACGRSGRVSHTPRAVMRLLSIALRPIDRMRARQVGTALFMDTRDMATDGRATRAGYPSIPMTTAATVAERLFGATAGHLIQPATT